MCTLFGNKWSSSFFTILPIISPSIVSGVASGSFLPQVLHVLGHKVAASGILQSTNLHQAALSLQRANVRDRMVLLRQLDDNSYMD